MAILPRKANVNIKNPGGIVHDTTDYYYAANKMKNFYLSYDQK